MWEHCTVLFPLVFNPPASLLLPSFFLPHSLSILIFFATAMFFHTLLYIPSLQKKSLVQPDSRTVFLTTVLWKKTQTTSKSPKQKKKRRNTKICFCLQLDHPSVTTTLSFLLLVNTSSMQLKGSPESHPINLITLYGKGWKELCKTTSEAHRVKPQAACSVQFNFRIICHAIHGFWCLCHVVF